MLYSNPWTFSKDRGVLICVVIISSYLHSCAYYTIVTKHVLRHIACGVRNDVRYERLISTIS
jgi:hypothetical protein